MQQAKIPQTLEFLTVAGTPCDPPLLVTRTQHEQILMYITLGAREKARINPGEPRILILYGPGHLFLLFSLK